jgi:hypothetical protein
MKLPARSLGLALLSTLCLTAIFWISPPLKGVGENGDREIPESVRGKRFTAVMSNGERFAGLTVTDVVLVHKEPWWRVSYSASSAPGATSFLVNPRLIQTLGDVP